MKLCGPQGGGAQRTSAAAETTVPAASWMASSTWAGQSSTNCAVTPVSRMESCGVPPCSAGAALRAHAAAVKPWSAAADPSSESEYLPPATNGALKCNSTGPCASAEATSLPPGPIRATRSEEHTSELQS